MALQDGYGNQLSIDEQIRRKEGLLAVQAVEAGVAPPDWDDALQEGRIALWRSLSEQRGDDPVKYAHAVARRSIGDVARGRPFTGQPSARGRQQAPIGGSLESILDEFGPGVLLNAAETLEGVELAYHRGEIYAALDRLAPEHKLYVVLRFWGGLTNNEIAPVLDRPVKNMARLWTGAIRPKLQSELGHLAVA